MPILAGEIVTAARLNRLQPRPYYAAGTGSILGAATNADVPDATITVTTQTAGATYVALCVWCADPGTGTTGAIIIGRLNVDGSIIAPLATFSGVAATDQATVAQNYQGTLATAGSHTLKLVASPPSNTSIAGQNCSIQVTVYEVV